MDQDDFIALIKSLPGITPGAHMGKADFRLRKRVIATLTDDGLATFRLTPEEQALAMERNRAVRKAPGAWGDRGWTQTPLAAIDRDEAIFALRAAWMGVASKRQIEDFSSRSWPA